MRAVITSTKFKKDAKKLSPRLWEELEKVLSILCEGKELMPNYRPHPLIGTYKGYYECHIRPDLLLIYKVDADNVYVYPIGSHANLFE